MSLLTALASWSEQRCATCGPNKEPEGLLVTSRGRLAWLCVECLHDVAHAPPDALDFEWAFFLVGDNVVSLPVHFTCMDEFRFHVDRLTGFDEDMDYFSNAEEEPENDDSA